jgi:ABC-type branched-subunit amino acid transport system substrate-binding protein
MRKSNEDASWLPHDRHSSRRVAAMAGLVLAGGCTFNRVDVADCETNSECRSAFGLGYVCGGEGLCDRVEPSPRCTTTYPPDLFEDRFEHRDRIVFGNLVDQSVTLFQAFENAAQLAYDQANGRGGVDGREFGAVFCSVEENPDLDDLDHLQAAVASVEFLADTVGVPGILGPVTSVEVQETFLSMDGLDVLMITPSATSPALYDLDPAEVSNDAPGLLWRTAASDALQGAVIASDMLTMRDPAVTSVAAIHEVGAYGEGLYEVFANDFRAGGGTVEEYPYEDVGQLAEVTTQAGASGVQEVLFISSDTQTIIGFLNSVASLSNYADKGLFMTDPAANPDVLTEASELALTKVRGTRPAPLDENENVYASFIAAFAAEFGDDVRALPFTPNVFDAAWLLTYGAAWALLREEGSITGTNIARGLRHVSSGPEVEVRPSGWNTVLQSFRDGNSVDVKGASGTLDFDPDTEETSAGIEVWQVAERNISTIYTVSP